MKVAYLTVIALLCFVIGYDCASNCYECSSCAEPFNNATATSSACIVGASVCMKNTIRYPGGALITKGCVPESACNPTSINIAGMGFWINCCTTDNCNSAFNNLPFTSAIVSSALFSILFYLY